ncbi:Transcriptional adapter 3 [Armadillidium vulgare]|nr:Transcriptional adapter 3 [Armadillidium vulgare]
MAPSPSKYKTFHKSSGKIFRQKDKNNTGNGSSSSSFNNGGCNGGSGNSSSGNNGSHSTIRKDEIVELKDCPLTLPDVSPLDHTRSLPRFNGLVMGEGVTMEELDGLQLELELLLSSMLVRQMALSHQIDVIQQMEKGKLPPRMAATPGKRLRQNDTDVVSRPLKKLKDVSGKAREILPLPGPPPSNKPPKMLEELLNSQNDDAEYMKIPPLGRHYTLRWAQEDLLDEQKESSKLADTKKKIKTESGADLSDKLLKEVIEAYRTIAATKQKKKVPTKKDKEVAIKAVKEREALVRQLDLISSS